MVGVCCFRFFVSGGDVDLDGDVFECGWGVEKVGVNGWEGGIVVIDDGVLELGGVFFGYFYDLVGVVVVNEVSLEYFIISIFFFSYKFVFKYIFKFGDFWIYFFYII